MANRQYIPKQEEETTNNIWRFIFYLTILISWVILWTIIRNKIENIEDRIERVEEVTHFMQTEYRWRNDEINWIQTKRINELYRYTFKDEIETIKSKFDYINVIVNWYENWVIEFIGQTSLWDDRMYWYLDTNILIIEWIDWRVMYNM